MASPPTWTLLGQSVVSRRDVSGGYTLADRGVATLADGREVFFKRGVDALTSRWLHEEWVIYSQLEAPFLPKLLDWVEGERPMLVLEALPASGFPPPWTPRAVSGARDVLAQVAATRPPPGLRRLVDGPMGVHGWAAVAADPEPLCRVGAVEATWLAAHLPRIVDLEAQAERDGDALVHHDFRSDNFCLADRPVVVDWNWACVGNPDLDVAFWLPSLGMEGGPEPWKVLPGRAELAAVVSGFFASREAVPGLPEAVRRFQRAQLQVAMRWMCHELGLPRPR